MTSIIHAPNKVPLMNSMPHAGSHTGHSEKLPSTDSAYKHAREPDALQADAGAHLQGTPDAAGGHNRWPLKPTLACPQAFTRTSSATSTPPYTTNTGENHSEETGHTTTGTTHSTAGTSTHSRKWSDQSLTYPGRPSCAASTQYHRRHANMGQTCSLLSKTILIMAIFAGIIGPVTPQYGSASQTPSTPSYQSSGEVTTSVQESPTTLRGSSSPPTPPTSESARLTTRETQRRQDGTTRAAYAICKSYRKGVAALDPSNLLHSVGIPMAFGMWPIPVTQLVMHAIKVPCDDIIRISKEEARSRHKRNIVTAGMRLFGRLFQQAAPQTTRQALFARSLQIARSLRNIGQTARARVKARLSRLTPTQRKVGKYTATGLAAGAIVGGGSLARSLIPDIVNDTCFGPHCPIPPPTTPHPILNCNSYANGVANCQDNFSFMCCYPDTNNSTTEILHLPSGESVIRTALRRRRDAPDQATIWSRQIDLAKSILPDTTGLHPHPAIPTPRHPPGTKPPRIPSTQETTSTTTSATKAERRVPMSHAAYSAVVLQRLLSQRRTKRSVDAEHRAFIQEIIRRELNAPKKDGTDSTPTTAQRTSTPMSPSAHSPEVFSIVPPPHNSGTFSIRPPAHGPGARHNSGSIPYHAESLSLMEMFQSYIYTMKAGIRRLRDAAINVANTLHQMTLFPRAGACPPRPTQIRQATQKSTQCDGNCTEAPQDNLVELRTSLNKDDSWPENPFCANVSDTTNGFCDHYGQADCCNWREYFLAHMDEDMRVRKVAMNENIYPTDYPDGPPKLTMSYEASEETLIDVGLLCYYKPHRCHKRNSTWRLDGRCGEGFPYASDPSSTATCDAFGIYPCCSDYGYCGNTNRHCHCPECTDYRTRNYHISPLDEEILARIRSVLRTIQQPIASLISTLGYDIWHSAESDTPTSQHLQKREAPDLAPTPKKIFVAASRGMFEKVCTPTFPSLYQHWLSILTYVCQVDNPGGKVPTAPHQLRHKREIPGEIHIAADVYRLARITNGLHITEIPDAFYNVFEPSLQDPSEEAAGRNFENFHYRLLALEVALGISHDIRTPHFLEARQLITDLRQSHLLNLPCTGQPQSDDSHVTSCGAKHALLASYLYTDLQPYVEQVLNGTHTSQRDKRSAHEPGEGPPRRRVIQRGLHPEGNGVRGAMSNPNGPGVVYSQPGYPNGAIIFCEDIARRPAYNHPLTHLAIHRCMTRHGVLTTMLAYLVDESNFLAIHAQQRVFLDQPRGGPPQGEGPPQDAHARGKRDIRDVEIQLEELLPPRTDDTLADPPNATDHREHERNMRSIFAGFQRWDPTDIIKRHRNLTGPVRLSSGTDLPFLDELLEALADHGDIDDDEPDLTKSNKSNDTEKATTKEVSHREERLFGAILSAIISTISMIISKVGAMTGAIASRAAIMVSSVRMASAATRLGATTGRAITAARVAASAKLSTLTSLSPAVATAMAKKGLRSYAPRVGSFIWKGAASSAIIIGSSAAYSHAVSQNEVDPSHLLAQNIGLPCIEECHFIAGYCNFCGLEGRCCKLGDVYRGCYGDLGGNDTHLCIYTRDDNEKARARQVILDEDFFLRGTRQHRGEHRAFIRELLIREFGTDKLDHIFRHMDSTRVRREVDTTNLDMSVVEDDYKTYAEEAKSFQDNFIDLFLGIAFPDIIPGAYASPTTPGPLAKHLAKTCPFGPNILCSRTTSTRQTREALITHEPPTKPSFEEFDTPSVVHRKLGDAAIDVQFVPFSLKLSTETIDSALQQLLAQSQHRLQSQLAPPIPQPFAWKIENPDIPRAVVPYLQRRDNAVELNRKWQKVIQHNVRTLEQITAPEVNNTKTKRSALDDSLQDQLLINASLSLTPAQWGLLVDHHIRRAKDGFEYLVFDERHRTVALPVGNLSAAILSHQRKVDAAINGGENRDTRSIVSTAGFVSVTYLWEFLNSFMSKKQVHNAHLQLLQFSRALQGKARIKTDEEGPLSTLKSTLQILRRVFFRNGKEKWDADDIFDDMYAKTKEAILATNRLAAGGVTGRPHPDHLPHFPWDDIKRTYDEQKIRGYVPLLKTPFEHLATQISVAAYRGEGRFLGYHFLIKCPMVHKSSRMTSYSLIPTPVDINDGFIIFAPQEERTILIAHATQDGGHQWVALSATQLGRCKTAGTYTTCREVGVLRPPLDDQTWPHLDSDVCAYALYSRKPNLAASACIRKEAKQPFFAARIGPFSWAVFSRNETQPEINCPPEIDYDASAHTVVFGTGILRLPPGCRATAAGWTLIADRRDMEDAEQAIFPVEIRQLGDALLAANQQHINKASDFVTTTLHNRTAQSSNEALWASTAKLAQLQDIQIDDSYWTTPTIIATSLAIPIILIVLFAIAAYYTCRIDGHEHTLFTYFAGNKKNPSKIRQVYTALDLRVAAIERQQSIHNTCLFDAGFRFEQTFRPPRNHPSLPQLPMVHHDTRCPTPEPDENIPLSRL